MKGVRELLLELVAVRSDTGTAMECDIAEKILQLVQEDPYFQKNPHLCGSWDGGDALGRPVIWALKKGRGPKTVLFSGHYDAVGTGCYGQLEGCCLNPTDLCRGLKQSPPEDSALCRDLNSGDWMFGRGCADMKAGLALNLNALLRYEPGEVNVLMTAVSDEENLSAGARQAVPLYRELAEQFGLDYVIGVESESTDRDVEREGPHPLINGGAGKVLPVVVAKGLPVHSSIMMSGINSAHIIAGIVQNTEYDIGYVSQDQGIATQPPAAQLIRDLKSGYDVSLPEYSATAFNMTFFMGTDPMVLIQRLEETSKRVLDGLMDKYNHAFDQLVKMGHLAESERKRFHPQVLTLEQLETQLAQRPDFDAFRAEAKADCARRIAAGETLQWASILYIKDLLAYWGTAQPTVILGIAPPYYPAVNNSYLPKDINPILDDVIDRLQERWGIQAAKVPYTWAMVDLSYLSCANPQSVKAVMENIPLPRSLYDMDADAMAALNIPTLLVGPAGRDIHQVGERVYLPDVEKSLPRIFAQIIESAGL